MDAEAFAKLSAMTNRVSNVQSKMKKATTKNNVIQLIGEMEGILADALRLIMPEISEHHLNELSMGGKSRLVRWWRERQDELAKNVSRADQTAVN
jgi:hypothetical protein